MKKILILLTAIIAISACSKDELSQEEKERAKVDQGVVYKQVLGNWWGTKATDNLEMDLRFKPGRRIFMQRQVNDRDWQTDFDTENFYFTKYYDYKTHEEMPNIYILHAESTLLGVTKWTYTIFKIHNDTLYVNEDIGGGIISFSENNAYVLKRVKD